MVASRVTRINDLQGDCGTTSDTIIIGIEAACGELVAATASATAIRLAAAVYAALEEFLVDGAVVDTRAAGPFPRILSTITGTAHPSIVL